MNSNNRKFTYKKAQVLSLYHRLFMTLAIVVFSVQALAQCGAGTPVFNVDLTGNPDSAWISTSVIRNDTCCGATAPDKCIKFNLTLDPKAVGIIFDVCDGALPPGALFYQIGCGPPKAVGEILCLNGAGPHVITFCKPGNNVNKYCITSIGPAEAGPPISVNDGCQGQLYSTGFVDTSIAWTSIFPGARGTYDGYLNCTKGCDSVNVTAQPGYPAFVDFEVCGLPLGGCAATNICDTVRAYFNSTLSATIQPQEPTVCFGSPHTTITAVGGGGTPPYTYSWSTGATTASINVNVGTYIVELGDSSGCPPTYDTVTVTSFASTIEANAGPDQVVCSETLPIQLNGSVQAASGGRWLGGNGTYNPSADSLLTQYTPTNAEISSGLVTLLLETTGNGSCPADTDTVAITIREFNASMLLTPKHVSCFGLSDGIAHISITGADNPYTFQWDANAGNQTSDSAKNLAAGTYFVTVSDSGACQADTFITITEPPILSFNSAGMDSVSCFGGNDGRMYVSASGGTPSYNYTWSTNAGVQSGDTATGLAQGIYSVTLTDLNGCQIDTTDTVLEPLILTLSTGSTPVTCFQDLDGRAWVSASGGTAGYTYLWDAQTGSQTQDTAINLASDTFRVTITDNHSCTIDTLVVVSGPDRLTPSVLSHIHLSCFNDSSGQASVFANGGSPGYTYLWSSSANNQADSLATGLKAGTHQVTITDQLGCTRDTSIVLNEPTALSKTLSTKSISCFGGNDGWATTAVSGGTAPYRLVWDSTGAKQVVDTAKNLLTGSHTIHIIDANGCSWDSTFFLTQPTALLITQTSADSVSCFGLSNGSGTVQASGGTGVYSYQWDANAANQVGDTAFNLAAGSYRVTLTDANGCIVDTLIEVGEPTLLISSPGHVDLLCFNDSSGRAWTGVSGGNAGYQYLWSVGASSATTDTVIGLKADTFRVTITDQKGCSTDTFVVVGEPLPLVLSFSNVRNVYCQGDSTGFIVAGASGGSTPYSYQWSSNVIQFLGDSAYQLPIGTYQVTLLDTNGCRVDSSQTLTEPPVLQIQGGEIPVNCYGFSDGKAFVQSSGGVSPYSVQWDVQTGSQTGDTASALAAGSYQVTVTDSNACAMNTTVQVTQPDSVQWSFLKQDVSCYAGNDGWIRITVQGGVPNYSYSWSANANGQVSDSIHTLSAGKYEVTITDNNQCIHQDSISLSQPDSIEVVLKNLTADTLCLGQAAQLWAQAIGGNGLYTYTWTTGQTTDTISTNPTQTTRFGVSVTDGNQCPPDSAFYTIHIINLNNDSLSILNDGPVCQGETVNLSAVHLGVYPPYTYTWMPNGETILSPISDVPSVSQFYTLIITDKCGFERRDSSEVIVHPLPTMDLPDTLYAGCQPLAIAFSNPGSSGQNYTHLWEFGDGQSSSDSDPIYVYEAAGIYGVTLTLTSNEGCVSKDNSSIQVEVWPKPEVAISADPLSHVLRDNLFQLEDVSFSSIMDRSWYDRDSLFSNESSTSIQFEDTGRFPIYLVVSNEFQCLDTATVILEVTPDHLIDVPNTFTPNLQFERDGSYDALNPDNQVFFLFTEYVTDFHLMVFDRWGEMVFESFDIDQGWNGYYKGKVCQQDNYVWKAQVVFADGVEKMKVGEILLLH